MAKGLQTAQWQPVANRNACGVNSNGYFTVLEPHVSILERKFVFNRPFTVNQPEGLKIETLSTWEETEKTMCVDMFAYGSHSLYVCVCLCVNGIPKVQSSSPKDYRSQTHRSIWVWCTPVRVHFSQVTNLTSVTSLSTSYQIKSRPKGKWWKVTPSQGQSQRVNNKSQHNHLSQTEPARTR